MIGALLVVFTLIIGIAKCSKVFKIMANARNLTISKSHIYFLVYWIGRTDPGLVERRETVFEISDSGL
jgi:hypothetical protein